MSKEKENFSPFLRQCFVTGAVCFNIIGHGCVMGYPAVLLPQLNEPGSSIKITKEQESWIAAVMCITILVGGLIVPPIMGRFGRKPAHIIVILPVLAGWFITILATSFEALIIGRVLQGLSVGMLMLLRSPLIGEYTSPKNRGAFLTVISLAQAFGIFFAHLIGSLLSWQRTALVCVFFSFASLVMTIYSPESPSWLVDRGRYDECREVFHWLRGYDEDDELEEMIQAKIYLEKEQIAIGNNNFNVMETVKKKEFYKPIIIMVHAYFMVQFAGGTIMASYSTKIIAMVMGPEANAHFWMIFLDSQRIVSNLIAVYVINKAKRRTMMFLTGGLCVFSHVAVAAYVYLKMQGLLFYDAIWIPALLINLLFFSVATGMVPLPSVIAGEVFPLQYRSIAGSISMIPFSIFMFLVLKTFPALSSSIGIHGTYLVYAGILTYNLYIIWLLLPETKGRTLQQIEDEFRGRPLRPEEMEARASLQSNPVEMYKRKMSMLSYSSAIE